MASMRSNVFGGLVILLVGAMCMIAACSIEGGGASAQYAEGESGACSELEDAEQASTRPPAVGTQLAFQKGGGGGGGGARGGGGAGGGGVRSGPSSSSSPSAKASPSAASAKPSATGKAPTASSMPSTPPSRVSSGSISRAGLWGMYPIFFFADGDDGDEDGYCIVQYAEED